MLSSTRLSQIMSVIHLAGFEGQAFRSRAAPPEMGGTIATDWTLYHSATPLQNCREPQKWFSTFYEGLQLVVLDGSTPQAYLEWQQQGEKELVVLV